jgi:hypothetical protein
MRTLKISISILLYSQYKYIGLAVICHRSLQGVWPDNHRQQKYRNSCDPITLQHDISAQAEIASGA